jgi:hypothetical protein
MKIQNQKGEDLIRIYENEVYRLTSRGPVNIGRTFNPLEIEKIRRFVRSADHYVTWVEWKKFLRSL